MLLVFLSYLFHSSFRYDTDMHSPEYLDFKTGKKFTIFRAILTIYNLCYRIQIRLKSILLKTDYSINNNNNSNINNLLYPHGMNI